MKAKINKFLQNNFLISSMKAIYEKLTSIKLKR